MLEQTLCSLCPTLSPRTIVTVSKLFFDNTLGKFYLFSNGCVTIIENTEIRINVRRLEGNVKLSLVPHPTHTHIPVL